MSQTDVDAVLKQHAQFIKAILAGDAEAIDALADGEVVDLAPGMPAAVGKAAFDERIRSILEQYRVETKSETKDAQASGDLAYVRADFEGGWIPRDGGPPMISTGKWLQVWRRQPDGAWKLFQNIWNRDD